ncbi:hypothetical protein Cgig2_017429 [Carnegiea gigantea]|uniref:Solute carrier family 35 member F1 n=1 Tax=Carnegiea gigantea TaxID=171969 RepID=A0A9Q1GM88_9CARY|nr:hypothetical protein Cgig2_017429 [Carnegiea gigantea]
MGIRHNIAYPSHQESAPGVGEHIISQHLLDIFLELLYALGKMVHLCGSWLDRCGGEFLRHTEIVRNFIYAVVKAYQYTSLTSVMLLDCWAIPCVIILTWLFLKTKYGWKKFVGVVVCVLGVIMVVLSDVHAQDRKGQGSNPLKGDLLVIAGATLYAVSNVSEVGALDLCSRVNEFLVKNADRNELMAMLGMFGAVFSAIQISILEHNELKSIHWSAGAALPFIGFSVAMFLFYSLVPVLLKMLKKVISQFFTDDWVYNVESFSLDFRHVGSFYSYLCISSEASKLPCRGDREERKSRAAATEREGDRRNRLDEECGVQGSNQDDDEHVKEEASAIRFE